MAVYTFSFDSKYAGHEATVTDHAGAEVAGSPVTLDSNGDAQLSLAYINTGSYRATVANDNNGFSVVDGVYNVALSIAAGGGALSTHGEDMYFEMTTPMQGGGVLVFDTFPDDLTLAGDWFLGLASGYYRADITVQFTKPAELHVVKFLAQNFFDGFQAHVPHVSVYPDGFSDVAQTIRTQVHIPMNEDDKLQFLLAETCADGTPTPDDLETSSAYIGLTKIG